jgi:hypothetical protein
MKEIEFRGDIPFDILTLERQLSEELPSLCFPMLISGNSKFKKSDIRFRCKVLLLIEPESVLPELYKQEHLSSYDLVISMSPWRAQRLGIPNWLFQPYDWKSSKLSFHGRKNYPVIIAASKFGNSPRSLYWLRREVIRICDRMNLKMDLFGPDWDMRFSKEFRMRLYATRQFLKCGKIPRWRDCFSLFRFQPNRYFGKTENKIMTLNEYSVSVVIENDEDALSEKLFDCLQSGVVPIFVGPTLKSFPFLESTVIRSSTNSSEVIDLLNNLSESELSSKRDAIIRLHDNPQILEDWSNVAVQKEFERQITNFCRSRLTEIAPSR